MSTKPPLICCRFCYSIAGFEECVNRWYSNDHAALTKTFFKCRQQRGFAKIFELKGIFPFLQELVKNPNDSEEEGSNGALDTTIPN